MSEAQLRNLAFSGGASQTTTTEAAPPPAPSRDYNRQILDALKSTWKL
jgi:hypothetical protein